MLANIGGLYECDAEFDPHYTYFLSVDQDYGTYKMYMVPKGGMVLVFEEKGTYQVDAGGMSLSLTPNELVGEKPDELSGCTTFKVDYEKLTDSYNIELIDARGKVWE